MQISDITGPTPYPVSGQAAQATVDALNASGGISGHKVNLTVCDAQSSPNTAEACARKAVSSHDVAVVGGFTLGVATVMPVLTAAKIPYIPAEAFDPPEFTAANSFPVQSATSTIAGMGYIAGKNCSSSVIVNLQDPEDAFDSGIINAALKAAGKPAAKTVNLSFTPGDYSVQASQVNDTKAACVISILNPPNALSFYPALASTGSKQRVIGTAGDPLSAAVVTKVGKFLNGALVAAFYPAYSEPAWAPFRAAVAKYSDPSKYDFTNQLAEGAYVDLLVFENAVQKVLAAHQTVTSTSLQSALDKETAVDANGLLPPLNFSKPSTLKGQPRLFNPDITVQQVKDGNIVSGGGGFIDMTSILNAGQA